MLGIKALDRYVAGQLAQDLHPDGARLSDRLDPHQPDRHAQPPARSRSHHERDRDQLRLLDSGERVHRHAGGGALRHGIHGGRDGPAFRAHRGQGGRVELLSPHAADLPRVGGGIGARLRRGGDGPGRHVATARDPEGQADPADPVAVQFRLPRRRGVGLYHPLARRQHPAAQAGPLRAAGVERFVPRPDHHRRQRELR